MAVSFVKQLGGTFNKAAGGALAHTFTGTVAAGNLIVAQVVFDNGAVASKPIITGISRSAGETASWLFLGAARSTSATAGAFSSGELWCIQTTVLWPAAAITVTFDLSTTMKSASYTEFSGAAAVLRSTVGTNYSTTTTAASAVTTGTAPQVGDLALGLIFGSNVAVAQAGDNDTTGGSWSAPSGVGSTGSTAATNNYGIAQYKILTAASHQTLNNSAAMTAGNGAVVAILQASPPPITAALADAIGVTDSLVTSLVMSNPKVATLTDTFDTQIDPAKWPTTNASPVWEAGRVKMESVSSYPAIATDYIYDATGSSVFARVVPPAAAASRETALALEVPGSTDGASIIIYDGPSSRSLLLRRREGSANFQSSIAYDAAKHAWLRIRMVGSTQFKFDTSPDGTAWTDLGITETTALNMTACRVVLNSGQWAAEPDISGFAYFDSVNTSVATAKMETLTDDFAASLSPLRWDIPSLAVWEAGQAKLTTSNPGYTVLTSLQAYDLRESAFLAKMTPAAGRTSREFNLRISQKDNVDDAMFIITDTPQIILARYRANSTNTNSPAVGYEPVAHQWLRIRLSGSTMYWEASPNGTVWTEFWSIAVDASKFASVSVYVESGQWQAEADNGSAYLDNVNTPPAAGLALNAQDALGLADSVSSTQAVARSSSDAIGLLDSRSLDTSPERIDPTGLADAVSLSAARSTSVQDALGLLDSKTFVASPARIDLAGLTDSVSISRAVARSFVDPLGVTDQVVTDLAGPPAALGRPPMWTGIAWVPKPGKVWNGSVWAEKPWKRWNGSVWENI